MMIQSPSAKFFICVAMALSVAATEASTQRRRPAEPVITCAPGTGEEGHFELHYGEFRHISGTLTASATAGEDMPVVAIEIEETNRDTTVMLSLRNAVPRFPDGSRLPIYWLTFEAQGREEPAGSGQRFDNPVSFGGRVRFSIDNLGGGRFAYRVDYQDPGGAAGTRDGTLETPMANIGEINLLCAGARFSVRDLRVRQ
jgi:hypothetical protein